MEKLDPEYPSERQMKEMWEALETGDDRAVLAVLQKRRAEMKTAEDIPAGDRANPQHAGGSIEAPDSLQKRR